MQEFVDFLHGQPPYDRLTPDELARLAATITVRFVPAGAPLALSAHDTEGRPGDGELSAVIRTGSVELLQDDDVVDVLGVGDTLTDPAAPLWARAERDTVVYELRGSRAVLTRTGQSRVGDTSVLSGGFTATGVLAAGQEPVAHHMRPVLWAAPDEAVRSVARRVTEADTSCALVRVGDEVRIATDRDFRSRVVTGEIAATAAFAQLAVGPVESVAASVSVATALVRMVEAGVHHLVVTDHRGIPVGVVRAIDLGAVDVRDPLLIRAAVDAATDLTSLAQAADLLRPTVLALRRNDVPPLRVAELQAAITDAIVRRALALSGAEGSPDAGVPVSWIVLGSTAREEPMPGSDLDTALVWDGPDTAGDLLRRAAGTTLGDLERCGLRRCPDGANATNPLFSRSAAAWTAAAQRWVTGTDQSGALLLSSIIADSRPLTEPRLGDVVSGGLLRYSRSLAFLDSLLRYTVSAVPPVGFVRGLLTERTGAHRGDLNLKRGGLTPIVSLARWAAITTGDVSGGTVVRLRRAGDVGLLTQDETDSLVHAFTDVFGMLAERETDGLESGTDPSTWVSPDTLDALSRRQLRASFRTVAAIQTSVSNQWRDRVGSR